MKFSYIGSIYPVGTNCVCTSSGVWAMMILNKERKLQTNFISQILNAFISVTDACECQYKSTD
jgi:hypothetical protein